MLYEERFVCAMRAGHPALQAAWNLDTFCRQRFALGSFYGGSLSGAIDDTLRELGYHRHVAVSLQHFALIPELLRQSDLLAVIPASLVRADDGLVLKDLPFPATGYQKLLLWHERNHADPAQQWLRGQLAGAGHSGGDGG